MDEKTAANPQSAVYNEKAYDIAGKNTLYGKNGRVMVSKDDEWLNEPEWEEMFTQVASESRAYSGQ